ncbi:MAG: hypothetical protein HYX93_06140, partial [Chloroflexi bacterium]|nr:hypothetical protein [Chloroflexota bacterium]
MKLGWLRARKEASKGTASDSEGERASRPSATEAQAPKARHLWGKEFPLVAQGLDEAQVTSFVNDLLNQYNSLLQEHEAVGSVRGFSKQMLEDAERQVASVRARGKRDAELEAARILSEAQQQATQTLSQAKRRAEEITGQEVRDLIQAAQLRAELVERQSKIQAQKFFLQVRDEVQGQITNEV